MLTRHLASAYFKTYFYATVRNSPGLFFTLIFPPLLLLLAAAGWDHQDHLSLFVVFFNYGVQTVAFMLLGMGVSQERHTEWAHYLRTLPVGPTPMILGRLLHTGALGVINLVTTAFVGLVLLHVSIPLGGFCGLVVVALLGAIPMAMMGLAIGYRAGPETARSVFTLCNLLLLFGAFALPGHGVWFVIRACVPTYQWYALSHTVIHPQTGSVWQPLAVLTFYSVIFLYLFVRSYNQTRQYRKGKSHAPRSTQHHALSRV